MTLARCAALLKACADLGGDITVTSLSAVTGLPKSTVSRLLKATERHGFIEAIGIAQGYRPGPLALALSRISVDRSGLVDRMDDMIAEVVAEHGHTGYVSVLEGAEIVAMRLREGSQVLRVVTPVGTRYPAFATAVGRTLLARLSDAAIQRLHPRGIRTALPNSPKTVSELLQRVEAARRMGYAQADNEANLGVGTVAIAIRDPNADRMASACISFPLAACTASQRSKIIAGLCTEARRIGLAVGDPYWTDANGHGPHLRPAADERPRRHVA
jgi:DNA-binding IclR family transcriptional regulator